MQLIIIHIQEKDLNGRQMVLLCSFPTIDFNVRCIRRITFVMTKNSKLTNMDIFYQIVFGEKRNYNKRKYTK